MHSIREYTIDLTLAPEERWAVVDPDIAGFFVEEAIQELYDLHPKWAIHGARAAASALKTWLRGTEFVREINGLAAHAGVLPRDLLLLNLLYDLTSYTGGLSTYQGCTGAVLRQSDGTVVIARNMDWAFPTGINHYTTLYRYVSRGRTVLSVGLPGFTGIISGLNTSGLAITLNQASTPGLPTYALPVPWLIRQVLQTRQTCRGALAELQTTPAAAGGFYLIADQKHGALVESTGREDTIQELGSGFLVTSNHFSDEAPDGPVEWGDTFHRHRALTHALRRDPNPYYALNTPGVVNDDTAHKLILDPTDCSISYQCMGPRRNTQWKVFQ